MLGLEFWGSAGPFMEGLACSHGRGPTPYGYWIGPRIPMFGSDIRCMLRSRFVVYFWHRCSTEYSGCPCSTQTCQPVTVTAMLSRAECKLGGVRTDRLMETSEYSGPWTVICKSSIYAAPSSPTVCMAHAPETTRLSRVNADMEAGPLKTLAAVRPSGHRHTIAQDGLS